MCSVQCVVCSVKCAVCSVKYAVCCRVHKESSHGKECKVPLRGHREVVQCSAVKYNKFCVVEYSLVQYSIAQ